MQRIILSLILSFSVFLCFPQEDTIYKKTADSTYVLKYSESSVNNTSTNTILTEIAKSIPKIIEYTEVSLKYFCSISLTDVSKTGKKGIKKIRIAVVIKPQKPTGDVVYKTFDISITLTPSLVSFNLDVADSNGIGLRHITEEIKKTISDKSFSSSYLIGDSLNLQNPNIRLSNIEFQYNDSDLIRFNARKQLIDDYYNSEFILSSLEEKFANIDLTHPDLIKIYDIKLKEIEKSLAEIAAKNYIEKLGLYSNDPIDFINKYSKLNVKVKEARTKMTGMLSSLDKVYFAKAKEYFSNNDTANALAFYEKSIVANPYYALAFLEMARIYYYMDDLFTADQKIIHITTKLNPDQATIKQTILLSDSLLAGFISKGEKYIKQEDFHEALKFLNEAKLFCTSVKVITCTEKLQVDIATAKYGIYSSFIVVSQKAIDHKVLDMATIYISKAKDYQIENATDIISSQEADILLGQLIDGLTLQGISLNKIQLYDSALAVLQSISDLCKKYNVSTCSDKILPAIAVSKQGIYKSLIRKAEDYIRLNEPAKAEEIIAEARKFQQENSAEITATIAIDSLSGKMKETFYQKYISDGISYLKISEGINAVHCFKAAKEIESKFLVKRNPALDSLIDAAAQPYISNYIEKGLVNIWGNEPEKAKAVADTVRILLKENKLDTDSALLAELNDLDLKISELFCKHTMEKYNEHYRTAYQKVAAQSYVEAVNYFKKCITTATADTSCHIDYTTASTSLVKYTAPAKYQKYLFASDSSAAIGSYKSAIENYFSAEKYSATIDLATFGLTHTDFSKHLLKQDKSYILKVSEYYFDKKNSAKTFECLEILRNRNISDSIVTEYQNKLAKYYCKNDFTANPEQKCTEALNKYPVNNSWYLPFRKTYTMLWKELKKKK